MKNLLVITLFFSSFGAMAETTLRCKWISYCETHGCAEQLRNQYSQIVFNDGWFSKKISLDGKDYSDSAEFGDDYIQFGTILYGDVFDKYEPVFKLLTKSLIMEMNRFFREPQKSNIFPSYYAKEMDWVRSEWVCEKIN